MSYRGLASHSFLINMNASLDIVQLLFEKAKPAIIWSKFEEEGDFKTVDEKPYILHLDEREGQDESEATKIKS